MESEPENEFSDKELERLARFIEILIKIDKREDVTGFHYCSNDTEDKCKKE